MGDLSMPRIEIDGRAATVGAMWFAMAGGYGHFTAMQVRDREVRGIDLHLARLDEGTRALFGTGLDGERIRELVRHALGDDIRDASVRVNVFGSDPDSELSVLVAVRGPASMPSTPQSLQTAAYQRPLAHIKHVGGFGQAYHGRRAKASGFDEAAVVWPDAPALHGISMQVLERELSNAGVPWRRAMVRVADIGSFDGAFVTNSRGIAPVGRIDETIVPTDSGLVSSVVRMFDAAPWDQI